MINVSRLVVSFSLLTLLAGSAYAATPADYYVSATGDDTTGNGTQAAPFATVQKALSQPESNMNIVFMTDMNFGTPSETPTTDDNAAVVTTGKTVNFYGENNTTKTIAGRFIAKSSTMNLNYLNVTYTPPGYFTSDRGVIVTEGSNCSVALNSVDVTQPGYADAIYIGRGSKNNDTSNVNVSLTDCVVKATVPDSDAQAITMRSKNVNLTLTRTEVRTDTPWEAFAIIIQGSNSSLTLNNSIVTAEYSYAVSVLQTNVAVTIDQSYLKGWRSIRYGMNSGSVEGCTLNVTNSVLEGVNKSYPGSGCNSATIGFETDPNNGDAPATGVTAVITNSTIRTEDGSYTNLGLLHESAPAGGNNIDLVNCTLDNNSTVPAPECPPQPSIESPNGNVELINTAAEYYVSADGDDTNGVGTKGAPFATAQKALSQSDSTMNIIFMTDMNFGAPTASPSPDENAAVVTTGKTVNFYGENNTTKTIAGRFIAKSSTMNLNYLNVTYTPPGYFTSDRGVIVTEGSDCSVALNSVDVTQPGYADAIYIGRGPKNNDTSNVNVSLTDCVVKATVPDSDAQAITMRSKNVNLTLTRTEVRTDTPWEAFAIIIQGSNSSLTLNNSIVTAEYSYAVSVLQTNVAVTIDQSYLKGWRSIRYGMNSGSVEGCTLNVTNSVLEGVNKSYPGSGCNSATIGFETDPNNGDAPATGVTAVITNSTIRTEDGSYTNLGLLHESAPAGGNNIDLVNCTLDNNSTVPAPECPPQPSIESPNGNVEFKSTATDISVTPVEVTVDSPSSVFVFGTDKSGTGAALEINGANTGGKITAQKGDKTDPAFIPPSVFRLPETLASEVLSFNGEGLGSSWNGTLTWTVSSVAGIDRVFRVKDGIIAQTFSVSDGTLAVNAATNTLTIYGVTGFSTWYAGNATSLPATISSFSLE